MRFSILCLFLCLVFKSGIAQQKTFTVYFESDNDRLSTLQVTRLDSFIRTINKSPADISGFTDSRGSEAYNRALSQRRADHIKSSLDAAGIPVNTVAALGEAMPVVADDGDVIKGQANRRVEIRVKEAETVTLQNRDTVRITPPPEATIQEQLSGDAVKAGSTLSLDNIYFIGGRHHLLPASLPQLNSLLAAMQTNPALKIAVEGHVCCVPDNSDGFDFDTQTNDLSYRRAKAIYDYLLDNGIEKKRMTFRGFGHSRPQFPFPEKNADEQSANRRVEIRIIAK